MPPDTPPRRALWPVPRRAHADLAPRALSPDQIDASWLPLSQPWLSSGPEPHFRPGWARLHWHPEWLFYEILFLGPHARNAARRLNEPTWRLGEVGELFLQLGAADHYFELHLTPENQRLQLRWPLDGPPGARAQGKTWEAFTIADPAWMQSATHVTPDYWSAQALLPLPARLGNATPLVAGVHLRTAVCRYDATAGSAPVLSTTAPLPVPNFHRRTDWNETFLSEAGPRP